MGKGESTRAEEQFMEAIKIAPKYAQAYNSLGLALLEQERFEEAVERFSQSLKLNPNSVDTLNNLGIVWLKKGKFMAGEYTRRVDAMRSTAATATGFLEM